MKRVRFVTFVGFAFLALGCPDEPTKIEPQRLGQKGETCLNTNDCDSPLACIRNACTESDFDIQVGAKVCVQIDCASDEDCCEPVPSECTTYEEDRQTYCEPYLDPNCSAVSISCSTDNDCAGAGEICDPSFLYCVCAPNPNYDSSHAACSTSMAMDCIPCAYSCQEERCLPSCDSDTECSTGMCDEDSGRCIECEDNDDCFVADSECRAGMCVTPCEQDENCPLFHTCNTTTGDCDYAGCANDHECQFAFNSAGENQNGKAALCIDNPRASQPDQPDSICSIPCENDAECGRYEVCKGGGCVYMGCESDQECRAELGLVNLSPTATFTPQALCREPG